MNEIIESPYTKSFGEELHLFQIDGCGPDRLLDLLKRADQHYGFEYPHRMDVTVGIAYLEDMKRYKRLDKIQECKRHFLDHCPARVPRTLDMAERRKRGIKDP